MVVHRLEDMDDGLAFLCMENLPEGYLLSVIRHTHPSNADSA